MEPSSLLTQENEQISHNLAREDFEEHFISADEVKKDPNAIFIEDNPQKALEKLLNLSNNDNYEERLQYTKHLAELMDMIGEEGISSLDKITCFIYQDRPDIRRAFLDQITPLVTILQRYKEQGYEKIVCVILSGVCTLLHSLHYDIKEKAAQQLSIIGEILNQEDREKHLLPQILTVGHDYRNEENRMIAARMLNQMGYLFGRDLCEQFIGAELLAMMEDGEFGVRKETVLYLTCTIKVVSTRFFGQKLLQPYFKLCKDTDWEVRQACAQIIFDVSNACMDDFTAIREKELTDIMIALAKDSNPVVKVEAYKNLGPFISTLQGLKIHEKLIEYYLRMTDKNLNSLTSNNDIMYACAYNFPAVVFTLGRLKWPILKKLFHTLLRADARIKKPLACSLHEIAKILGEVGTEKYLLPVLLLFLKDSSDDVKFGVIKNIALFFKVFSLDKREHMIDILLDLLKDQIKWRIRELIAQQISKFTLIFSPETNFRIIAPISFKLCNDPVAAVREEAVKKVYSLFKALYQAEPAYKDSIIENMKGFSQSNRFTTRQSFILMCEKLMKDPKIFKVHFMGSFIPLGSDKVPNVRLSVAKVLQKLFSQNSELHNDPQILELVKKMKKDRSQDVKDALNRINLSPAFWEDNIPKSSSFLLQKATTIESLVSDKSQPEMSQSLDFKDKIKTNESRLAKAKMLLSRSNKKLEGERNERGEELNA